MTMNNLVTEIAYLSVNHFGEELCGDNVQIVESMDGSKVIVLSDGLGSGVKANILSILTSKMLSTMIANNISIKECVQAVIETLPICKERHVAYSTFSIVKISNSEDVEIYNYDNPLPFYISGKKVGRIDYQEEIISNKKIYHAKFQLSVGDSLFLLSDGIIHAGIGASLNFGWSIEEVEDYMASLYNPDSYSAKSLSTVLLEHVERLYNFKPGDDATVATIKIRKRQMSNIFIGPPTNRNDDNKMVHLFMAKAGKHIVCGGTTSKIFAKCLDKEIIFDGVYLDKEIPPTSIIEGIDVVSEGIITLKRVLSYAKNLLEGKNSDYFDWCYKEDGASQIARILFEESTDINIFVGCAANSAHQEEDDIAIDVKLSMVNQLKEYLEKMSKKVTITYF